MFTGNYHLTICMLELLLIISYCFTALYYHICVFCTCFFFLKYIWSYPVLMHLHVSHILYTFLPPPFSTICSVSCCLFVLFLLCFWESLLRYQSWISNLTHKSYVPYIKPCRLLPTPTADRTESTQYNLIWKMEEALPTGITQIKKKKKGF